MFERATPAESAIGCESSRSDPWTLLKGPRCSSQRKHPLLRPHRQSTPVRRAGIRSSRNLPDRAELHAVGVPAIEEKAARTGPTKRGGGGGGRAPDCIAGGLANRSWRTLLVEGAILLIALVDERDATRSHCLAFDWVLPRLRARSFGIISRSVGADDSCNRASISDIDRLGRPRDRVLHRGRARLVPVGHSDRAARTS